MEYDYHVHSTYSDGSFPYRMLAAAEDAGLSGVGFADHCNVSAREPMRRSKHRLGFNLDRTHERRRDGLADLAAEYDLAVFDAVEMDYDPRDEAEIRSFLDDAGFDYAVGSVHEVDGRNVQAAPAFADDSRAERAAVVDRYFEKVVALVESGLFDVAAHLDLVERTGPLRGFATRDHYERVADALADSRTVPEINAGRATREDGAFHPGEEFLDVLLSRGVAVTVGTDAHAPGEVGERVAALEALLDERGVEPVRIHE